MASSDAQNAAMYAASQAAKTAYAQQSGNAEAASAASNAAAAGRNEEGTHAGGDLKKTLLSDAVYGRDIERRPWTLSTEEFMQNKADGFPIEFYVNPGQYAMDTPIRQTVVQAKGGPVFHRFKDPHRGNTCFGYTTMNITFNSGSILPRPSMVKGPVSYYGTTYNFSGASSFKDIPEGLLNYFRYLKIVQSDNLYTTTSGEVKPNYAVLIMNTIMFPYLEIRGFFTDKAGHSENAENPTEINDWTGTMLIVRTTPALTLDQIDSLKSNWENHINGDISGDVGSSAYPYSNKLT